MSSIPSSNTKISFSQITKQITEQETAIFKEGANASELVNGEFFKTTLQPLVDSLKILKEYQKGVSILQKSKRVKPENIETFKTSILNEESRVSKTVLRAFAMRMNLVETKLRDMAATGNSDEMGVLTASYVSYFESQLTGEDSLIEQFSSEIQAGFTTGIRRFIDELQALNATLNQPSGVSKEGKSSSENSADQAEMIVYSPTSSSRDDRDSSPLGTSIQSIQNMNSTLKLIEDLDRQIKAPIASQTSFSAEVKKQLVIAQRELASTMAHLAVKYSEEKDVSNKEIIREFSRGLEDANKKLVAISTFVNRPAPSRGSSSSRKSATEFNTFVSQKEDRWSKIIRNMSTIRSHLQKNDVLDRENHKKIERVSDKIIEELSKDIPALEELATRASLLGNTEEAKQTTDKKDELVRILDQARTVKEFLASLPSQGSSSKPPKAGDTGRFPGSSRVRGGERSATHEARLLKAYQVTRDSVPGDHPPFSVDSVPFGARGMGEDLVIPELSVDELAALRAGLQAGVQRGGFDRGGTNLCYLIAAMNTLITNFSDLLDPVNNPLVRQYIRLGTLESNEQLGHRKHLQRALARVAIQVYQGRNATNESIRNVFAAFTHVAPNFPITVDRQSDTDEVLKQLRLALGVQSAVDENNFNRAEEVAPTSRAHSDTLLGLSRHVPVLKMSLIAQGGAVRRDTYSVDQDLKLNLEGSRRSENFGDIIESAFNANVYLGPGNEWRIQEGVEVTEYRREQRLRNFPSHLTFPIARVGTDPTGLTQVRINTQVNNIPTTLDMARYHEDGAQEGVESRYSIRSINLHAGGAQGGHYQTVNFNPRTAQWEWQNDTTVRTYDSLQALITAYGTTRFAQSVTAITYTHYDARDIGEPEGGSPRETQPSVAPYVAPRVGLGASSTRRYDFPHPMLEAHRPRAVPVAGNTGRKSSSRKK